MDHLLRCHEMVKDDFVRGQNCYLRDASGRRYVDLEAGVWCAGLGHNHPQIREAIKAQIERVAHLNYRYTNRLAEEAAAALLDTLGIPDGKTIFLSSGSEAVEFAIRIARLVTGKRLFLTLCDSYLSAYGAAGETDSAERVAFDWSSCRRCDKTGHCGSCQELLDVPFGDIGAFVLEPGSSSGAVRFPPKELIRTMVRLTAHHNGLLLVDEVTTGLGRTGEWYGFQHYGLKPDIVVLGKGLGNGYPVSAVAMRCDIAEVVQRSGFHYVQSHQNDPLGCAIALAVMRVIQREALVERGARIGRHLRSQLEAIGRRHKAITDVRGTGLMLAMEFDDGGTGATTTGVYHAMLRQRYLVGYNPDLHIVRLYPALTIEDHIVADFLGCLSRTVAGLA